MTCQLSEPALVATIAGSRAMCGRVGLRELAGARGHLLADHVPGFVPKGAMIAEPSRVLSPPLRVGGQLWPRRPARGEWQRHFIPGATD
jgi:hypothetical protein